MDSTQNSTSYKLDASYLKTENLTISFNGKKVADRVSFELEKGKVLGIVGESGSGKTLTARAILQLVDAPGKIEDGSISFQSHSQGKVNLLGLNHQQIRQIRGREVGMIFQEPGRALNPVFRCGNQMTEVLRLHLSLDKQKAKARALSLFEEVGLSEPERMFQAYPHQLSGGQKQRIMIALALAGEPKLLIADEPTTSLDVGIQVHIIQLLKRLQQSKEMSLIFITHDLELIRKLADQVVVMQKGKVVENSAKTVLFRTPQHPYTKALLACRPPLDQLQSRLLTLDDFIDKANIPKTPFIPQEKQAGRLKALTTQKPLWSIQHLSTYFKVKKRPLSFSRQWVKAVDDVSFDIYPGETLGLVGESGSGKTTLGRSMLKLVESQQGEVFFNEKNILKLSTNELRKLRPSMQIIFQDPFNSLNPRLTIGKAIEEPMRVHNIIPDAKKRKEVALALLKKVGLQPEHYDRHPHAFSGGERQRISIARALALKPKFMICDECVSSLDVSIQAQILNLLKDLQVAEGLTYLFISHDLRVIRQMCDRIMVMKDGKIVEIGATNEVITNPQHVYTKSLIEAVN